VTSFRTHVALCGAGAAMVAALSVAVAPTAYADDQWGAISISQDGSRGYWVINYPSQDAAQSRVTQMCYYPRLPSQAPPCNAVVSFTDCGAVAQSGGQFTGGTGPSQAAAEQAAMGQLPGSTIRKSACNNGESFQGGPA
jgi:hypothetical protein